MQGYQQRLIIFFLSIATINAKVSINFFNAYADTVVAGTHSSIFSDHIELWTNVTGCPESQCKCEVHTNGIEEEPQPVKFLETKPEMGTVKIVNLEPNTEYSFTMTCQDTDTDTDVSIRRKITTDYGRPSPPQDLTVSLVLTHLEITWSPPSKPVGPIHHYRITIDNTNNIQDIPSNNQTSYKIPEVYVPGTRHTIFLSACNKDKRGASICSNANEGKVIFEPVAITSSTLSTTTQSFGVHSYSISISLIIFSLLLFINIKY